MTGLFNLVCEEDAVATPSVDWARRLLGDREECTESEPR